MGRKKPDIKLRSSNETQVAGMIARMFGVVPSDNLQNVVDQIADHLGHELPEFRQKFGLFAWECPVPSCVMAETVSTLIEDLCGSNGAPYVVKDSDNVGRGSLWVVRASFDDPGCMLPDLPVRALVNHFLIGDEWLRVTAYQLETCLRKLKSNRSL